MKIVYLFQVRLGVSAISRRAWLRVTCASLKKVDASLTSWITLQHPTLFTGDAMVVLSSLLRGKYLTENKLIWKNKVIAVDQKYVFVTKILLSFTVMDVFSKKNLDFLYDIYKECQESFAI